MKVQRGTPEFISTRQEGCSPATSETRHYKNIDKKAHGFKWRGKPGRLKIIRDEVDGVFRGKAEEYGIKVEEKSEYKASSECPFCHTKGARRCRGLFYCGNVAWR
jgi:hypothetical protein